MPIQFIFVFENFLFFQKIIKSFTFQQNFRRTSNHDNF